MWFEVLECGDLSPLWPFATCREHLGETTKNLGFVVGLPSDS
jgi:hypothetical protein